MKKFAVFAMAALIGAGDLFAVILGIDRGAVRLELDESTGAVVLYTRDSKIKDPAKQLTAIMSSTNPDETSRYMLKVGDVTYELAPRRNDLKVEAEETLFGISITYTISNVASVLLDFLFFSHIPDILQDTVRIAVTVTNLGEDDQTFAFKGIFDTYLGEGSVCHFSNAKESVVKNETFYENVEDIHWIDSSDRALSMKLILDNNCGSGDVVPPKWAAVCSRSNAFNRTWKTPITVGTPLTSFSANNNSAAVVSWETVKLAPEEEAAYAFYITTSLGGEPAATDLSRAMLGFFEPDGAKSVLLAAADR